VRDEEKKVFVFPPLFFFNYALPAFAAVSNYTVERSTLQAASHNRTVAFRNSSFSQSKQTSFLLSPSALSP
jgi:hypothetical protein